MPTYGAEKRRDMSRSVLPSTSRKSSREYKRIVHHQVRTKIRTLIAREDWDNDSDLYNLDPQRNKSYQGIKVVVRERRGADKVAPLMRWAEANADKLGSTPQERYAKLRSMLPPNVIGWHAMTHVEIIDEFAISPRWWWRYGEEVSDEERRHAKQERYLQLYEALYKVCTGRRLQKRLNEALRKGWWGGHEVGARWDSQLKKHVRGVYKACPNCSMGARPLLGIEDIPLFIAEWYSPNIQNRFKWKHLGQGVLAGEEPEVRAYSIRSHGSSWGNAITFLKEEGLLDKNWTADSPRHW